MKPSRTRPFVFVASLAAAAAVIGADTTKKPAAPKKPAPAKPEEAAPAAKKPAVDEVIATVNGEAIKSSEVDAALTRRGVPAGALPPEQKLEFARRMVDNLVIQKLIDKAAADVKIEDKEVDSELAKIREQNKISDEQMAGQLKQMGMTMEELKKDIRNGMRQQRWIDGQLKGKYAEPTEAEAKEFYDKNPQHFEQQEEVRASHILIRVEKDAKPEDVATGLKKAQAALERVKKEDFAKVAGEISEDPSAKQNQGDLSFFTKDKMVPEFANAAFAMKKDELSKEPVRSDFGFHVIKVTDRKDAKKVAFADEKVKITEYLGNQRKQPLAKTMIDEMRAKAKVDIKLPPPAEAPAAPAAVATPPVPAPDAKPAEKRKPIEAVTPPVSVPPAEPKK